MENLTCTLFVQDSQIEEQLLRCIQLFDSIKVLRIFKNSIEVIEKLYVENPDILFLNTDIEEIKNLDLLRIINRPPFIIGITSDVSNISYLLDNGFSDVINLNFNLDVFCKKMSKIINTVNSIKFQENVAIATESSFKYKAVSPGIESKNFIFTKHKKISTKIKYDDILYVKNTGNLLKVEDIHGNSLYHLSTLKRFLGQLPQDKFIRINKSIIVDSRKIDKFNNNFIFMKDESFKVSRVYLPKLKEILKQAE